MDYVVILVFETMPGNHVLGRTGNLYMFLGIMIMISEAHWQVP